MADCGAAAGLTLAELAEVVGAELAARARRVERVRDGGGGDDELSLPASD